MNPPSPATSLIRRQMAREKVRGRGKARKLSLLFDGCKTKEEAVDWVFAENASSGYRVAFKEGRKKAMASNKNVFIRCSQYKSGCRYSCVIKQAKIYLQGEHSSACGKDYGPRGLPTKLKNLIGDSYRTQTAQEVISQLRERTGEGLTEKEKKDCRSYVNNMRHSKHRNSLGSTFGLLYDESMTRSFRELLKRQKKLWQEMLTFFQQSRPTVFEIFGVEEKELKELPEDSILKDLLSQNMQPTLLLSYSLLFPGRFIDWALMNEEARQLGQKFARSLKEVAVIGIKEKNAEQVRLFVFGLSTIGLMLNRFRCILFGNNSLEVDARYKNFTQKKLCCLAFTSVDRKRRNHIIFWIISNSESASTYEMAGRLGTKALKLLQNTILEVLQTRQDLAKQIWNVDVSKLLFTRSDGFLGIAKGLKKVFSSDQWRKYDCPNPLSLLEKPHKNLNVNDTASLYDKLHIIRSCSLKNQKVEVNKIANITSVETYKAALKMWKRKYRKNKKTRKQSSESENATAEASAATNFNHSYGLRSLRPFWSLCFLPLCSVNYTAGVERKNREYKEKVSYASLLHS